MEANEENKRDRADEILAKKTDGEEGNFDGVTVKTVIELYAVSDRQVIFFGKFF